MIIDGYCTLGIDREYDLTDENLLNALDAAAVDCAVITPVDRQLAVYNREGNDFMLKTAVMYRDRLIPACSVNPWFGAAAGEELKRAAGEGARILVLHPLVQGFAANDELVWPLLEIAASERLPVYIHTGPPGNSTPCQLVDLADRYPMVDFIMGHCGATNFWNDVIVAGRAAGNVCVESSLARPFNFRPTSGNSVRKRGSWAHSLHITIFVSSGSRYARFYLRRSGMTFMVTTYCACFRREVRCDCGLPHALGNVLGGKMPRRPVGVACCAR